MWQGAEMTEEEAMNMGTKKYGIQASKH